MGNLVKLRIRATSEPSRILSSFEGIQLSRLRSFDVDGLAFIIINGLDFVSFTESVPQLEELDIGVTASIGVTDLVIERMARNLPHLSRLYLVLENAETTEASLISLGKHCSKLESCNWHGPIDFDALIRHAGSVSWPNLVTLAIDPATGGMDEAVYGDPENTALKILELMPKLDWRSSQLSYNRDTLLSEYPYGMLDIALDRIAQGLRPNQL